MGNGKGFACYGTALNQSLSSRCRDRARHGQRHNHEKLRNNAMKTMSTLWIAILGLMLTFVRSAAQMTSEPDYLWNKHSDGVVVSFNVDGTLLAGIGDLPGSSGVNSILARIWDARDGGDLPGITNMFGAFADSSHIRLEFAPSGDGLAAAGTADNKLVVSFLDSRSASVQFSVHFPMLESYESIEALTFHPVGHLVAVASRLSISPPVSTVRFLSTETGAVSNPFTLPGPVYAMTYSPDGTLLAIAHDQAIRPPDCEPYCGSISVVRPPNPIPIWNGNLSAQPRAVAI